MASKKQNLLTKQEPDEIYNIGYHSFLQKYAT